MFDIIGLISSPVFTLLGTTVSWVELFGFISGALCVWAVAKQKTWNWPVGIINNILFIILFLGVGLYADAFLQVIFAIVAFYGWYNWSRGSKATELKNDLPIRDTTLLEAILGVVAIAAATALVGSFLSFATNSTVPIPDAFVLGASLVATYGQAKKIFQQWYVWIAVDIVSIPLYFSKGLALTGILYIGFLALCIYGLIDWTKTRKLQASTQEELVTV
jgi:nicotinamide mononucleotide transporter